MLQLPVLFFLVAVVSAAADTGKRAATDDLANMLRQQDKTLANIERQLVVKFAEISSKFFYLDKKVDSLKYDLSRVQTRLNAVCPSGFFGNTYGCYKFVAKTMNYNEAKAFCISEGSHLWEVGSGKELTRVVGLMKENNMPEGNWYSIGGQKMNGKWVWPRTDTPMAYTNWLPGKPGSTSTDNRVILYNHPGHVHHMTMRDAPPNEHHFVICEI